MLLLYFILWYLFYFMFFFKFVNPSMIMNIWPSYGLVIEYDMNGNILKSWHDKSGKKVKFITNAVLHDKKLYLGSYSSDRIAIVNY